MLKTKDIYDDAIYYENADSISKKIFEENKDFELFEGDILLAIVGQGSIGKVNIFREQNNKKYIFTRALGLLRVNKNELLPDYLRYFLLTKEGKALVEKGIDGATGQLVLKTTYLKDISINVPPIDIQKEIVMKIDRQMRALDGLRLLRAEAGKQIDAILTEVWSG